MRNSSAALASSAPAIPKIHNDARHHAGHVGICARLAHAEEKLRRDENPQARCRSVKRIHPQAGRALHLPEDR